jgi:hypothetical protein
MAKVISIYAHKGGQGKTSIAVSYAQYAGSHYFTNDYRGGAEGLFKDVLGEDRFHVIGEEDKEVQIYENSVFDFGGYRDARISQIMRSSDLVIVPLCYQSRLDLDAFYNSAESAAHVAKKLMVIINNTATKVLSAGLSDKVQEEVGPLVPVKIIKKSAYMTYLANEGKSPLELVERGAQGKHINAFRSVLLDVFKSIREI